MITTHYLHRITDPDLMKYPTTIEVMDQNLWYTLGDLHGNALKLLYFMIAVGAVEMTPTDYEAYANHYITYKAPDKATFDAMEALLAKVKIILGASIRLIGDEFADRGRDDALTFSLISRFIGAGGVLESMLSNHTAVLIKHMERALFYGTLGNTEPWADKNFIEGFKEIIDASTNEQEEPDATNYYYRSILALRQSLIHGSITPNEFIKQYNLFTQLMKVFSYDYPEDLNGEPILYSHAGTSIIYILTLTEFLFDEFTEDETKQKNNLETYQDMLPFIDAINRILNSKAKDNTIATLMFDEYDNDSILSDIYENRENLEDNSIQNIHGHEPDSFGLRKSLETICGTERRDEPRFWRAPDIKGPKLCADLLFTKTYKTPELAKKAYAERNNSVGTKNTVLLSGSKRGMEDNTEMPPSKKPGLSK